MCGEVEGGRRVAEFFASKCISMEIKDSRPRALSLEGAVSKAGPWLVSGNLDFGARGFPAFLTGKNASLFLSGVDMVPLFSSAHYFHHGIQTSLFFLLYVKYKAFRLISL